MSKKVVDGIEISDDVVVSEYEGKFSGSFELEVEKAVSMAYDDEVTLIVQARLDSYTFKPTKYGDLRRVNTFKVDSVTVRGGNLSSVVEVGMQPGSTSPTVAQYGGEQEMWPTSIDPSYPDEGDDELLIDPSRGYKEAETVDTGRNYSDPLLAKFLEDA